MAQQTHIFAGIARYRGGSQFGLFRNEIGNGGWQRVTNGLPEDAQVHAVTVHPEDTNVVYVGSHDGPYRSTDRGKTFERLNFPDRGVEIWSILVHPKKPKTLYAGASPVGVYRSDNGGDSWKKLPAPAIADRITMAFPCRVMRFAVDPTEADTLYATVEVNGVMRSRDAGESWQDCSADLIKMAAENPKLKSAIGSKNDSEGMLDGHALCVSPAAPGTVIVAVRMGLFRSTDRGGSWRDMEVGRFSPLTYGRDIRVSPHDPRVLYAALSVAAASEHGRIYRSNDLGETWKRFDEGLNPASTMMAVTPHPRDPNQVYCATRRGEVFGTQDGGKSWQTYPLPDGVADCYAIASA
ncbi:MAG: hypothetical protein HY060_05025 [Proteobacteria bacterium]|nr:hypothetical protein [Pseudomonadota bacterium]